MNNESYTDKEWDEIIDEFYEDKNIMRRFKLLHKIISQKALCKDNKCPIFTPLRDVAVELDDLPVFDLEMLRERFSEDSPTFRLLKQKIENIALELTKVLEEAFTLASTKSAERTEREREHQRKLEWTKMMAMYKLPMNMDYTGYEKMEKNAIDVIKSSDPNLQINGDNDGK